jgi:lipopolysaccharide export system protein LptC
MTTPNNTPGAEVSKDAPSATHARAPASHHAPEHDVAAKAPPALQRTVRAISRSSAETPPSSFGALLDNLHGSRPARRVVLRQLQESFGNHYVGRVIQLTPARAAGAPERGPRRGAHSEEEEGRGVPFAESVKQASTGGRSLEAGLQNQLARGLGADLSEVRVHTDERADRLARSVNAAAFTTGPDIFFSEGAYQPRTRDGLRLLAHEAAHTVQQSRGPVAGEAAPGGVRVSDPSDADEQAATRAAEEAVAAAAANPGAPPSGASSRAGDSSAAGGASAQAAGLSIQRFGGAGGAPPVSDAPTASTTKDLGKTVDWGGYILSRDPEELKTVLFSEAKKGGIKGAQAFITQFGDDSPDLMSKYDADLINGIYVELGEQLAAVQQYRARIVEMYNGAATAYTYSLLDESEALINKEAEHYGVHRKEVDPDDPKYRYTGEMDYEKEMTNPGAKKDLVEAAAQLQGLYAEMMRQRGNLHELEVPEERARYTGEGYDEQSVARRDAATKEVIEAEFKYQTTRAEKEAQFPILAAYRDDNPEGLKMLAQGGESADAAVVPLIIEKLANIQTVRENVEKVIWKQESIREGTKAQMEIDQGSLEDSLINEYASDIELEESIKSLALAVFTIGIGMLAAIPTGGASLGASVAATAAATTSLAISGFQAMRAVQNYELEMAAHGTTFDKAKAISKEDPSLFWLALDIVGVVVDVHGALAAFRSLGRAVREVIAARALIKEAEAGAKAAGMTEKQLKSLRELSKNYPGLYERILSHISTAEDIAKPGLKELEAAARAQYQALVKAGRLEEIKNISEELFVEQMLSGARMQTVISGAEGVKRTAIITSLMDPSNPILRGVLAGNAKEMDLLLQQHGNWKQLLGMLDQGTPEMRQAARQLFAKRGEIEKQVQELFQAELAGSPSSQLISDIDRSTIGVDSGKKMIQAEEYVKARYGPGWSEALRMNFYTDAMRLSIYEQVMGKLTIGQRMVFMRKVTEETEIYNIARMLHHAHGEEGAVREVAQYAKSVEVDLKDPRIQELLPKLTGGANVEERNKLLREIDSLAARYEKAAAGSPERLELAQQIASRQMRANLFTEEAYIGPGSMRALAGGVKVVGMEAYQYALSNLDMIRHFIAQSGGDVVLASRQYEIYKYMNRFAQAAEMGGLHSPDIEEWKNFTGFVYSGKNRQAMEDISHLRPGLRDPEGLIKGPIMDEDLKQAYDGWRGFSERVLRDLKEKAMKEPLAWTPSKEALESTLSSVP